MLRANSSDKAGLSQPRSINSQCLLGCVLMGSAYPGAFGPAILSERKNEDSSSKSLYSWSYQSNLYSNVTFSGKGPWLPATLIIYSSESSCAYLFVCLPYEKASSRGTGTLFTFFFNLCWYLPHLWIGNC